MRRELFDELVASIKEMKAVERGALKPARVTRSDDLLATNLSSPPCSGSALTPSRTGSRDDGNPKARPRCSSG
jgi:hypothetical protein